jgi:hypothetical protein
VTKQAFRHFQYPTVPLKSSLGLLSRCALDPDELASEVSR